MQDIHSKAHKHKRKPPVLKQHFSHGCQTRAKQDHFGYHVGLQYRTSSQHGQHKQNLS